MESITQNNNLLKSDSTKSISKLAIASLVLGILSIIWGLGIISIIWGAFSSNRFAWLFRYFFNFLPIVELIIVIVAIILGAIAINKIRKKQFRGMRIAIIGIILGLLGTLSIAYFYFVISFISVGIL